jgi:hypothetical protein
MIGQIIATIFIAWFLIGLMLTSIGSFINGCTNHITNIDEIGYWLLGILLGAVVISIFVGLIILF